jgi:hypothetical protein
MTPTTPRTDILEITPSSLPDAEAIATQDAARLARLERAVRALRARTTEIPADLDAARATVEVFLLQQDPTQARKLAAREVRLAAEQLDEAIDALADAQRGVADGAASLPRLAAEVAARRERLEVLGDFGDDPREKGLGVAQLTHDRLRRLAAQVAPWLPAAQASIAILAQATVAVLRRDRVAQLARDLAVLQARRDALTEPDAHDQEAAAVLTRMVERVGHPLPVPTIRWPAQGADPFAPPVVEPEP